MTNLLIRADGTTQIGSSLILSCEYVEQVNTSDDVSFGCAAASCIAVEVKGNLTSAVNAGETLTYYQVDDSGNRTLIGKFYVDKPTIASKSSYKFEAYDAVSKLDKDLSEWLYGLNTDESFPYSLKTFAQMVCSQCGLTFSTASFLNDSYSVKAFYSDHITGRDLMGLVAELAGGYIRATTAGAIVISWYAANSSVQIAPTASGGASGVTRIPYFSGELSFEKYTTAQIQRVQIHGDEADIGAIYPTSATGVTYEVSNNILLTNATQAELLTVAQNLYNRIHTFQYRPCTVKVPRNSLLHAGEIINVVDANGNTFSTIIMKLTFSPDGVSIESTGNESRDSTAGVASRKYENIFGKMLTVEMSVEGLKLEATALDGRMTLIEATVDGIGTKVEALEETAIATVEVQYALGVSQTEAPTSGWSTTAPAWEDGKYMWQRTVTTYSDSTEEHPHYTMSDPTCIQGAKGEDGESGSSSYTFIRYSVNSSGNPMVETPTSETKYIGIYTGDNSTVPPYTQFKWSKYMGDNGADGADGEDGETLYTWIKYADNSSGSGMSDNPTGKKYIGIATNKTTPVESTIPGDYTWSKYVGENGIDGADGLNSATVFLYKRGASSPTKPSSSLTYTFATGVLSGTLSGWSQNIPASDGNPCYVIQASAVSTDATDSISSSEWSNPVIFVEDGTNGTDGAAGYNTAIVYLYKRSETAATISWTNTLTYNFSNKRLTSTPTGWSQTIPSGDNPLYVTAATAFANTNTDTIPYTEWTTPTILAENGADGTDGADGVGISSIITEYYLSTSSTTQTGGSWSTTAPAWVSGKYIWTRSHITWDDGTTSYTTPQLDNTSNDFGSKYSSVKQTADKVEWLVKSGTTSSNFTITDRLISLVATGINITGYVTFNALSTQGSTTINGSNITTGTINANLITTGTLTGIKVISRALWTTSGGYTYYKCTSMDIGSLNWYMERCNSAGTVVNTYNIASLTVGLATEWDMDWLLFSTESGYAIRMVSGGNMQIEVGTGYSIGIGNHNEEAVNVSLGNTQSYLYIAGSSIRINAQGSMGSSGQVLVSGGQSNSVYWGSAVSITSIGTSATYTNYKFIIVIATPASGYTPMTAVLPGSYVGNFQIADEATYTKFYKSTTGISVSTGTGSISYVYGVK